MNIKALIAEFIGVFAICFMGISAIITVPNNIVAIAFAFAFIVATMATATGAVSGGHLNPAVSIAFLLTGKQELKDTVLYIIAQCLGAIVACYVLSMVFSGDKLMDTLGMKGTTAIANDYTISNAFVAETIATFFLMFVIWGTAVHKDGVGNTAPLLIGLTVALDIFAIGNITGAGMNPARSLAPAIIGGNFTNLWIYIAAPILGAAIAALLWKHVLSDADHN